MANLLKGYSKDQILNNFKDKKEISYTDVIDLVKYGLNDVLIYCIKNKMINNHHSIDSLLNSINAYSNISTDVLKALFVYCDKNVIENVSWFYFYEQFLKDNIEFAEVLLEKGVVDVSSNNYEIITKYVILEDLPKIKELFKNYKINIYDMLDLVIHSFSYSKKCFDYFLTKIIHYDVKFLMLIVTDHHNIDILKYLYEKGFLNKETDYYEIFKKSIIYNRPNVIDYLRNELHIIPPKINSLTRLAKEYNFNF